ncbi:cytochrome-c peroxidase [Mucilaginibacter sp.]
MKKAWIIIVVLFALVESAFYNTGAAPRAPEKEVADQIIIQIDSFSSVINNQLLPEAEKRDANPQVLRQLFIQSRLAYKKFEWAAEYFNPTITVKVNGPPVPESEPSGFVGQPLGLQVIESDLYPRYDASKRGEIIRDLKDLLFQCSAYRNYYRHVIISNAQVWDATRLEVFRILTLGIAGFDAPLAKSGLTESAYSLHSMTPILMAYSAGSDDSNLRLRFSKAISYLEADTSFDGFNRAEFITAYGNPLTTAINQLQQTLKVPQIHSRRLLRQNAATLFDAGAFDATAYFAYPDDTLTTDKIALGEKLFYDPALSGSGNLSCASCHQAEKAFTDGLVQNKATDGHGILLRNAPTLLNAAFQPALFADMRETTLEGQAKDVIESKHELNSSIKHVSTVLSANAVYTRLFAAAYPQSKKTGIGQKEITGALTAYVQTLSILNSRFDEYMHGNQAAMDAEEINGFNLFMGKAKCGTCHYMPLFNGALPPTYTKMDAEVLGVPAKLNGNQVDSDPGRGAITHATTDDHAFKVPTVRNAARTAPYMHNGVFANLEELVDFYNNGGGAGMGLKVPNQTLSSQPLRLSTEEKHELIAFMKCLNNR